MGYEAVSLRDSVQKWIDKKEIKAGGNVITDAIFMGSSVEKGDYGDYTNHYFKDVDQVIVGLSGGMSIDEQIAQAIDAGKIVEGKSKVKIDYLGQVAKKGTTKINEKSFKKYSVMTDNSWRDAELVDCVEEGPMDDIPHPDSDSEIPF